MPRRNHDAESELFQALASPLRLRILDLLFASGGMTVSEIQQRLGIEAPNASQHLRVLRDRGLVRRRRDGTSIWYGVTDPELGRVIAEATAVIQRQRVPRVSHAEVSRTP